MNTTYIFSRKNIKRYLRLEKSPRCQRPSAADSTLCFRPVAHLPCPTKATLAVRCCPVYFELRTKKEEGKDTNWVAVSRWAREEGLHFTCLTFLCSSCPRSHLHRWLRLSPAQPVPAAVPHGVRRGVRGLHPLVRHAAGPPIRPGGQHPLPHAQRPDLVTPHSLRRCKRRRRLLRLSRVQKLKCWMESHIQNYMVENNFSTDMRRDVSLCSDDAAVFPFVALVDHFLYGSVAFQNTGIKHATTQL